MVRARRGGGVQARRKKFKHINSSFVIHFLGKLHACRERLRQEAAARSGEEVNWEDDKEREFRRKYAQLR